MALPTGTISIDMVRTALGAGSNDVATLCTHPNINKWSTLKPNPLSLEDYGFHVGTFEPIFIINKVRIVLPGSQGIEDRYAFHYWRPEDDSKTINRNAPTDWNPLADFNANYSEGAPINPATMTKRYDLHDFQGYDHQAKKPVIRERYFEINGSAIEGLTYVVDNIVNFENDKALGRKPFNNYTPVLAIGSPTTSDSGNSRTYGFTGSFGSIGVAGQMFYLDELADIVAATGQELPSLKTYNKLLYAVNAGAANPHALSNLVFLETADTVGDYKDYGAKLKDITPLGTGYYYYQRPGVRVNQRNTTTMVAVPKSVMSIEELTVTHITDNYQLKEWNEITLKFKTNIQGQAGHLQEKFPNATLSINLYIQMLDANGIPTGEKAHLASVGFDSYSTDGFTNSTSVFSANLNSLYEARRVGHGKRIENTPYDVSGDEYYNPGTGGIYWGRHRLGAQWLAGQLGIADAKDLTPQDWAKCVLETECIINVEEYY